MKKLFSLLAGLLLLATALTGCAKGVTVGPATGTLNVNATDAPPAKNVTAILVTVASVKVHLAGDGETTTTSDNGTEPTLTSDNASGGDTGAGGQWTVFPLSDNATTFDLLQIQGILHSLGSANLTPGTYTQVRLEITRVQVGLNGEAPQDATLPSGVLKVVRPFQVTAGMTTDLTFDFDADKMVTVTGNGSVIVKPVIKLSVSHPAPPTETPTPTPSSTDNTTNTGNTTA